MFPVYPLLCFNAAVALYLMRGWLEVAFVEVTNSPYRVSYLKVFIYSGIDYTPTTGVSILSLHEFFTFMVIVTSALIPVSRILALWHYYHAPLSLAFDFQYNESLHLLKATDYIN